LIRRRRHWKEKEKAVGVVDDKGHIRALGLLVGEKANDEYH
jgi:hypothetical protein